MISKIVNLNYKMFPNLKKIVLMKATLFVVVIKQVVLILLLAHEGGMNRAE